MKRKRFLILMLELILLIVVVGGVFFYTQREIAPTKVFVFKTDMAAGQVISSSNLAVREIPASAVTDKFVRNQETLIGYVTTTDVTAGQYAMQDLVTPEEYLNPLTTMDLSRMRMISFPVEMETSLAGQIKRGDTVDLLYTGVQPNAETGQNFVYSKIFMQDVVVWSATTSDGFERSPRTAPPVDEVGQTAVPGTEVSNMEDASNGDLSIVTVVVTGPQAEEIAARQTSGSLQVLGRFLGSDKADSTGYAIYRPNEVFAGNTNPERK